MYKTSFEPILKRGHTVALFGSSFPEQGSSFRCIAVDALPVYVKDFGALTASTWDNDNTDSNLSGDTMNLMQYRMRVLDNMQVRLNNPQSVKKWRTGKTSFWLPRFPDMSEASDYERDLLFMMSEFFMWEDNYPSFDLYSETTLAASRIEFTGWRYKMVGSGTTGQFELLVNGWPGMQ